ncbi:MAG: zf-HC2 domain-containing protein [Candidatus Dormibacteria bacterium]
MKKCQPRVLTPYLDGELPADSRDQVEEHLRSCAACGALLDEVTSARERVHTMGRAMIPNTVLMPALEAFRERAGIGRATQMELADVPVPVAPEAAPLADAALANEALTDEAGATDEAWIEAARDDDPELDADARYQAILSQPPEVEAEPVATWVDMTAEPEAPPQPELVSGSDESRVIPDPPPLPPRIPDPAPLPLPVVAAEPEPQPEPVAVVEPPPIPEAPAAPLPWEQGPPVDGEGTPATDELQGMPLAHQSPPWLEADAADAEDMEARGRRLVEEDLAAQWAMEKEMESGWQPAVDEESVESPIDANTEPAMTEVPVAAGVEEPATEPPPDDEAALAVAGMREELGYHPPVPIAADAPAATVETAEVVDQRDPLRTQQSPAPGGGIQSLGTQVKIGLGAAAAIILLIAAIAVVPRLGSSARTSTVVHAQPTPAAHPSAAAHGTPAAAPSPAAAAVVPSSPPSTVPIPALSGLATAGAGGSGYHVLRIRSGSPGGGVSRIVFDLEGPGVAPDAQLGRAADGTLYLQSAGTAIDPAIAAGFPGVGPVTGMSSAGGPGASLKLATSGTPSYSMYYLAGPARLVIDLR